MLYSLFDVFATSQAVNVLCWRVLSAFVTAVFVSLLFGNRVVQFLHHHQANGQPIREDGPQSHLLKKGTPTMGGLLILATAILSILLYANLSSPLVWICVLVLVVYGFVGFVDDYVKVTKETSNAMSAKMKLFLQFSTALVAAGVTSYFTNEEIRFSLSIPYFKTFALNLGYFYIPLAMIVIVGASNAVNLSDGLDGLAGGLLVIAFAFFMLLACICGSNLAQYFYIIPIVGASEVAVVCAAVIGGCVGFLWFNTPPAKVFMGDTGSLSLGALLGTVSIMLKQEILLAIVGGIFVVEALSVMIQVFWYRRTGKRFFRMAPIHHHFEQLGWKETTVVLRFWIVALLLAVIGLLALTTK